MGKSPHLKFSCSEDLTAWIEKRAAEEQRSISSMIRVLLYEAKLREEEEAVS